MVLLVGVEGERLGEMGVGLRRLAQITQGDAQIPVGPNEERGVVLMLGQGKTFLIQRSGGLELPVTQRKHVQSRQNKEALRRIPHLVTQLAGSAEGLPDFESPLALVISNARPSTICMSSSRRVRSGSRAGQGAAGGQSSGA